MKYDLEEKIKTVEKLEIMEKLVVGWCLDLIKNIGSLVFVWLKKWDEVWIKMWISLQNCGKEITEI